MTEPRTALKRSANAIRAAHFDAGTEPTAKERATILAADRVEDLVETLWLIVDDVKRWSGDIQVAGNVAQAVSATRMCAATDRFRKLQQLADELVGIWCVEDGLR
jgi:hypothetical protein